MKQIAQSFTVSYSYNIFFTRNLFDPGNNLFAELISGNSQHRSKKVLFVIDEGLFRHHPDLVKKIETYSDNYTDAFRLTGRPVFLPGGESAKNDPVHARSVLDAIHQAGIDRHSFVVAVGGGAVIDAVGYAAAIAHRGIRIIRIPTTVLAQNDAAVGVKNGINAYGKKNFLGTFVPPVAVINDMDFLKTLDDRDWRAGISEAVKVALLKDPGFFRFIRENTDRLNNRDETVMQKLIERCAELHVEHISTAGDPFEMGSSRPLDFGHWSAHKLEQLTGYNLKHGEAVAAGIALDVVYSFLEGRIDEAEMNEILETFRACGFSLFVPELESKTDEPADPDSIFHGLEEFREHLGGRLTIMLLEGIGKGVEVNDVDYALYRQAIQTLKETEQHPVP